MTEEWARNYTVQFLRLIIMCWAAIWKSSPWNFTQWCLVKTVLTIYMSKKQAISASSGPCNTKKVILGGKLSTISFAIEEVHIAPVILALESLKMIDWVLSSKMKVEWFKDCFAQIANSLLKWWVMEEHRRKEWQKDGLVFGEGNGLIKRHDMCIVMGWRLMSWEFTQTHIIMKTAKTFETKQQGQNQYRH